MRKSHVLVLLVMLCSGFGSQCWATQGEILGTVTDESGAVIPGADVTITSLQTSFNRAAASNDHGFYRVPHLEPGEYKLQIEKQGFFRFVQDRVRLDSRAQIRIDAPLTVGQVSEQIVVNAGMPVIETESGRISDTVGYRTLREVVMNGRGVHNWLQSAGSFSGNGGLQINCSLGNSNGITLDGAPIEKGFDGNGYQSLRSDQEIRAREDIALEVGSQRQLFVDDYLIGSLDGLNRVFHSPERHPGNPLIIGDRPWEQWVIEVNGRSVFYDEEVGQFRMYYLAPEMDPAAPHGMRFRGCLATSRDGVNWLRPNLGQLEWKWSRQNNLLSYGENWMRRPNVILDTADLDPARRYKMTYVDVIDGRTAIAKGFSHNGVDWRLNADGKPWFRQRHNSNLLGWDPRIRQYVLFPRMQGGPNTIGRSTSPDLINWSEPTTVLAPESADKGNNFTALAAFLYEGLYLGLLSVSNSTRNLRVAELVVSRDGISWQRVEPRSAYFPRGAEGAWDSDGVIPVAPVVHNDRIWIYYTGWNLPYSVAALTRAHQGWFENGKRMQRAIGLAKLRLDGFASLHAGPQGGTLTTRLITMTGSSLLLNARVRGELRVEILDENNQPIPRYTATDCRPMRSDEIRHSVLWKGRSHLTRLAGKPVRLRFHLKDGDLYSFKLESNQITP